MRFFIMVILSVVGGSLLGSSLSIYSYEDRRYWIGVIGFWISLIAQHIK